MTPSAHLDQFRRFAAYNRWMNERIYSVARELGDDDRRRDLGAFFGSIESTLNHLLLADRIWLGRCRRAGFCASALAGADLVDAFDSLGQTLYASFDELAVGRAATDAVLVAFADELTDEALVAAFRYSKSSGEMREHPLYLAVGHLFNHQTHHRGQVTTLLHQLGKDPGVTDFIAFATM